VDPVGGSRRCGLALQCAGRQMRMDQKAFSEFRMENGVTARM
jgi:hypothetical protein